MTNTPFFNSLKSTTGLVRAFPTSVTVLDSIRHELSDDDVRRVFFDRLQSADWIPPLQTRGYFDHPPPLERLDGGQTRAAYWAQSRYLARMASQAPALVADVLAKVDTDNSTIVRDIVEAAKAMPPEHAARLVPKIGELVSEMRLWYLLDDVGDIASSLANGEHADDALALVARAFAVDKMINETAARHAEDYAFFEGLNKVIPALTPKRPRPLVEFLITLLRTVIGKHESRSGVDDYSYVWRPAVEDREQNEDYDLAAKLVPCVRDALEIAIRENGMPLVEAARLLAKERTSIFRRLILHLVAELGERDIVLVREIVLNRAFIGDHACKHEYARAVRRWFTALDVGQRVAWCNRVERDAHQKAATLCSDDDAAKRRRSHVYWMLEKYHWVYEYLPADLKDWYDREFKELEEPDLSEPQMRGGFRPVAFESAYSAEELREMGLTKAIQAVSAWRPDPGSSHFDGPSVEGLVHEFKQYISSNVKSHSSQASHLKGVPAPYVRSFLRAMEDAVKAEQPIDVPAVFDLCAWVVSQPIDQDTVSWVQQRGLIEHDWQWARDAVADLASAICEARDENDRPSYSLQHRDTIWRVLPELLNSSADSYIRSDDAGLDPRVTDWATLALNSPRGKAMLTVLAYAEWILDHETHGGNRKQPLVGGFNRMPEVRDLLANVVIKERGDFMVLAAVGWKIGVLYWIDSQWLETHAAKIFDLRKIEADRDHAFGWAAWNAFLLFQQPHKVFYRILRDQFSYAVDQASQVVPSRQEMNNPLRRVAEHLIVLYGRGDLGDSVEEAWTQDYAIIERLVCKSDPSVRSGALRFAGRSLKASDKKLPKSAIDRFVGLWERYWRTVGETDAKNEPDSNVFGYWFASGVFDNQWSLERLEEFVIAAPKANPDHLILERLAAVCEVDLARSVRILGMLVDGDSENWRIHSWKGEASQVLARAIASDGEIRDIAEQIVDRLGRRGYLDFGDLLK